MLVAVRKDERAAVAWAAVWFFLLLLAYFILRPIRETMGLVGGIGGLRWMFFGTFIAMLIAIPIYSWLVAKFPRRAVVPLVYQFFALCVMFFGAALRICGDEIPVWLAAAYFVWTSVFSLFSVSVFWSVQVDLFTSAQGKRLFGLIAAGGTLGALVGSVLTSQIVSRIGIENLIVLPMILLQAVVLIVVLQEKQFLLLVKRRKAPPSYLAATGGNPLAGFTHVFRSPYLLQIALYVSLISFCGTTVYFQQAEIVSGAITDADVRTQFFAYLNLGVQFLTLIFQTLVVSRLITRVGLPAALCVLPIVYLLGLASLAVSASLVVIAIVDVARRSVVYGVTVPAREVLFTTVSREDKYKAKSFVDTVLFRGTDAATGSLYSGLRALALPAVAISILTIPATLLWCGVGWWLGRRHDRLALDAKQSEDQPGEKEDVPAGP